MGTHHETLAQEMTAMAYNFAYNEILSLIAKVRELKIEH